MQPGKVWLVGAGPSDPGLLTIRGKQVLEMADVVVYDYLAGAGVLSIIPPETRMIYVGKRAGNHTVPQEEINQILLREAQAGNRVVRLKGGDPFLFGRGGEELSLLAENGIPFEIVPGITSAIAVPAYAGIPVTHRESASSLHIITGKGKRGTRPQIEYEALVKAGGTLVFLMGVDSMADICKGLQGGGMSSDMPAAVIENGTSAHQRWIVGTIGTLCQKAEEKQIKSPAVIVVGEVCQYAEKYAWAEKRPLNNKRIIVTRPKKQSEKLIDMLTNLGAEVIAFPTIQTTEIIPNIPLQRALETIQEYDWIVFTSPVGVRVFFNQLKNLRLDIRCLGKIHFAAIGTATAREIESKGILVDYIPETYSAEALGKGLAEITTKKEKILIPRAKVGSEMLIKMLSNRNYTDLPIYETKRKHPRGEIFQPLLASGEIDYVTFTSASTVHGFTESISGISWENIHGICIGEQTAQAAKGYGMKVSVAKEATIESIVEKMLELERKGE